MVTLNTLNTLIDDIMLEIRNSNISESESLSRNQVEQWVIQYRAKLIKQDVDKGRDINPDYVQEINAIQMEDVDYDAGYVNNNRWVARTSTVVPKTIDFHFGSGLIGIADLFGNKIQLGTEYIANIQDSRRYTSQDYIAYKKGDRIYISGPNEIQAINVRGVFENPSDANSSFSADDLYPIPVNMLPVIKDLIINKELRLYAFTDNTNNGENDLENKFPQLGSSQRRARNQAANEDNL